MKKLLAFIGLLFLALGFVQGMHAAHADPYSAVYADSARLVYSSTNVGVTTPVQLDAALAGQCDVLDIFDSSGQTLELMQGAAGFETRIRLITPGGNGLVSQRIRNGTRLAIRAVSATASAGEIDITCLQF